MPPEADTCRNNPVPKLQAGGGHKEPHASCLDLTPEQCSRQQIDAMLTASGWAVQTKDRINLSASLGVAVCELSFATGEPDYTLFVDAKAIGTVEAKPEGHSLVGVEEQSTKYVIGIPSGLPAWKSPLPFCYESTGAETWFTSRLDPDPRSRHVFAFHRPETLLAWVQQEKQLAQRLREFPSLHTAHLWPAQVETVTDLETSFAAGLRRALIQKATGSGKTFTAVNFTYRLVKYAGAHRVLFLVDRGNLGRQTLKEFQQFVSPVNNYKFTEEYIVQHLTSNTLDKSARVVIGTIQRVYSMLRGEKEPAPDLDDLPIEAAETLFKKPVPVEYNPAFPIEEFDFIITDECHRSIYNLWRQVLEYFDASLIGLTATPSKQTFGFFQQNLVMEYNHEKAVADGVNVGCDIYRINTAITQGGSKVDAGFFVDKRDRQTRKVRWEQLDEPLAYDAADLDRDVVAPDQIRTVLATFRDKVFTEMFPGRTDLPKTLIFAKDDTHADDIVRICREVFGKGNDFCQKITYRTGFVRIVEKKRQADGKEVEEITWRRASSLSPEEILSAFRNSYFPRIAVTVDMIATGTDIKPLEIVFFMRSVASKNFFEQMKGRGVRVVSDTEMEQVNPGIKRKTRYVIVDAVGVCERVQTESRPLEKKPTVSFEKLLDAAALGTTEVAAIESLAGRLIRLERRFDAEVEAEVVQAAKGQTLSQIAKGLLEAVDPDKIAQAAVGRLPSAGVPQPAPGRGPGLHDSRFLFRAKRQRPENRCRKTGQDRPRATGHKSRPPQPPQENPKGRRADHRHHLPGHPDLRRAGPEKRADQRPARHLIPRLHRAAQSRDHRPANPLQPPVPAAPHRKDAQGTGEETPRTTTPRGPKTASGTPSPSPRPARSKAAPRPDASPTSSPSSASRWNNSPCSNPSPIPCHERFNEWLMDKAKAVGG